MRFSFLCLIAATLLALGHLGWQWSRLPDPVASHFDTQGVADGFVTKTQYFTMMAGLYIGLPCLLIGTALLSKHLPDSLLNIPHKEYWLHPDRREAVLAETFGILVWIACLTQSCLLGVSHFVFVANVQAKNLAVTPLCIGMAIYLIAIFVIVARNYWKYLRVPPAD